MARADSAKPHHIGDQMSSQNPSPIDQQREPWQWPEEQWRSEVNRVRAGRSLVHNDPALRWPHEAQCAVLIAYDSDHETPYLRDGQTSPGSLAQGEYGSRSAVPRILDMLARHEVPTSFYVPAVSALLHPQDIDAYVAGGHEVAVHGWIHERNTELDHDAELDLISRATDVLERLSGSRPTGIRTPSWDFSQSTLNVIRELGFTYDSSLMADDEPYELNADGAPTGIIEIPVEWIRDDAPYFMMDRFGGLRPHLSPYDVERIWVDEFEAAHAAGGVFELTLHPHISGHRSRLAMVDRLLAHIRTFDNVWFGTHAQLADHLHSNFTLTPHK